MPVFFSRTAAAAQDVRYAVTNTNRVLLLVVAFAVEFGRGHRELRQPLPR